ncbi:MAG: phosphatidylserine decarboxylase family protein [Candidatus Zixiibacteriota bacterium]|nr:MAG: phosphatidylserine decarboxylase family protein [candidate division Zixibacteria bacterium]
MIAREGLHLIAIGAIVTLALVLTASKLDSKVLFGMSLVLAVLTLFTVFFFRDPDRRARYDDLVVVAPADGKVIGVEKVYEESFLAAEALKISIFLSIFDVHINRVPATGRIEYVRYNPGKFFPAFKDKASEFNEQTEIGMTGPAGHRLIFKQIAGILARRIVCRLSPGDSVSAGQKFGLIRFGSRLELYLPAASDLQVKPGDHVTAGRTVMGHLPSQPVSRNVEEQGKGTNVEI